MTSRRVAALLVHHQPASQLTRALASVPASAPATQCPRPCVCACCRRVTGRSCHAVSPQDGASWPWADGRGLFCRLPAPAPARAATTAQGTAPPCAWHGSVASYVGYDAPGGGVRQMPARPHRDAQRPGPWPALGPPAAMSLWPHRALGGAASGGAPRAASAVAASPVATSTPDSSPDARPTAPRLHVTAACAARLRDLGGTNGPATLRVAVDAGGCSGFQYAFELVDGAAPGDEVFAWGGEDGGLTEGGVVVVDATSMAFLAGATVDYSQELIRDAFVVADNPNSAQGCGCGASFAAK